MKKMLQAMLIIASIMFLSSCSYVKENAPQEVEFVLDYTFIESGSLTTKSGGEVYGDFYEKYVKTKVLTPKTFALTFTNKETGAVATIRGDWRKKHSLKLTTGEYNVTGTSHPTKTDCLDSLFISFNESVTINNETSELLLNAKYDSYMVMFDASEKNSVQYVYGYSSGHSTYSRVSLASIDNIYYAYYNTLWSGNDNNLVVTRVSGSSIIDMNDIPFEKGKYYYFNDISNSFDIPSMESGN